MGDKDTVLKRDSFEGFTFGDKVWEMIEPFLEVQAEQTWDIAYKAGYEAKESEFEVDKVALSEVLDNGIKQGRKEVVDWVDENMWKQGSIQRWQKQKKDWGIK